MARSNLRLNTSNLHHFTRWDETSAETPASVELSAIVPDIWDRVTTRRGTFRFFQTEKRLYSSYAVQPITA